MPIFKSYNDFIKAEHDVTASIGPIYGKRAKDTDGSLQSIPESDSIYITFDICPGSKIQEGVLEILRKEKIPCTIFITSDHSIKDQLSGIDYSIQGHSNTHKTVNEISEIDQKAEIENNVKFIKYNYGTVCKYYRFPNGLSSPYSLSVLKKMGIKPVSWYNGVMDSRTRDYYKTSPTGEIRLEDKFELLKLEELKGKIYLYHLGDNGDKTEERLKEFIRYCKTKNFSFAKL
jgi:peptidoglycan/xylan/chitin deacetylase (PgdA/CDA1 family)